MIQARRIVMLAALALAVAGGSGASAQVKRDYTLRVDAVELLDRGKEIDGQAEFSVVRGKFTYLFATEPNKAAFEADPEKYEIQMGGGCARMGPLSGGGTPRLYAVHDGKLYIFASESCRMTFQAAPQKFIAEDDSPPRFTPESRALARRLLGKAVDSVACLAFIDTIKTYRETLAEDRESGGKLWRVTNSLTLMPPDIARSDLCWNDICYGYLADEREGWMIDADGAQPMALVQRQSLHRDKARHFITILRDRDDPEMIMTADGGRRTIAVPDEGEVEVELLTVHRDGATTVLGLDEQHRVRLMTYRGRGPDSTFGQIEHVYSHFHRVGGLNLPKRVHVTFNGEPAPHQSGEYVEQVIDDPADQARLQPPSGK